VEPLCWSLALLGSIGSELACQVLQYHPSVLVCIDQDESGLFKLQRRLSRRDSNSKVEFCIADIIVVWVCALHRTFCESAPSYSKK